MPKHNRNKHVPSHGLSDVVGAALIIVLMGAAAAAFYPETPKFNLARAERSTVMVTNDAETSGGAGVIVGPGVVLTADHVVSDSDADHYLLTNYNGMHTPGHVIWEDKTDDLALVSFNAAEPLGPITPVACTSLKAGDAVIAIGHPLLAVDWAVTYGKVAADKFYTDTITGSSDLPLNITLLPGNSGGPVFTPSGELVGISDAVFIYGGGLTGLALAVPTSTLCQTLPIFSAAR